MATTQHAERILAVINRASDAEFLLEKAATLASAEHASVQIVRIVYDELASHSLTENDDAQRLKVYLMQSEHELLEDIVDTFRNRFDDVEILVVWHRRVSEGVIEAAKRFEADLVIKAVDHKSEHFPHHPDDWNLLRHTDRPVLMLNPPSWGQDKVVLGAVDLVDDAHDDASRKIIAAGAHLAAEIGGRFHVVYAYPAVRPWAVSEPSLGLDYTRMEREIHATAQRKLATIAEGIPVEQSHLVEGPPSTVVSTVARDSGAEIVVLGNAAREGVAGLLFGNTAEALLKVVDMDLLVLPT